MTHINIKISKAVATAEKDGIITAGMVGVPVSFMFDSGWDGLIVTAVFKGSGAPISVPLLGATETVVPWEVLKRPSTLLRIGAEGRLPDGTLVIPTTWATVGIVMSGANATDDLAKPPTPTAFDRIMSQIGNMNDLATEDKSSLVAAVNEAMENGGGIGIDTSLTVSGKAADAAVVGEKFRKLSEEIADGVSWNELKDKPFYLEKTLVVELTKDDFTVNDQDGYIKYMYRSTPKLDWFVSAESIAFEIEIVDTNGRRYTATQDSIDISFEKDYTDDGYEYWSCYSSLFEIVSGVDLDLYDDEYYYKDEWGVFADYDGIEFSEINIKIYRVDVKKIPESCLDAAIGKTAITVGSVLHGSEGEMPTNVVVPDLLIPIRPTGNNEGIYYDRIFGQLRTSGNLFPYIGQVSYRFPYATPTKAGSSISFDISYEGDKLWDKVGMDSKWQSGSYLFFSLTPIITGSETVEFLARGAAPPNGICAVAASSSGRLYTVVLRYTNNYKTLNVTIKCAVE